jgi:peptide/nickel transport system substrate-binding protein
MVRLAEIRHGAAADRRLVRRTRPRRGKAAIDKLNKAAMDDVVYIPTGFFKGYQAWRKNLTGVVKAPFPVFWDVKKA